MISRPGYGVKKPGAYACLFTTCDPIRENCRPNLLLIPRVLCLTVPVVAVVPRFILPPIPPKLNSPDLGQIAVCAAIRIPGTPDPDSKVLDRINRSAD